MQSYKKEVPAPIMLVIQGVQKKKLLAYEWTVAIGVCSPPMGCDLRTFHFFQMKRVITVCTCISDASVCRMAHLLGVFLIANIFILFS